MTPLIPLAIGVGAVYLATKNSSASKAAAVASSGGAAAVDVGMDPQVAQAVHAAVTTSTDKAALTNYASSLRAAGYNNSADAVTARAASL